jgi:hypothetical protein
MADPDSFASMKHCAIPDVAKPGLPEVPACAVTIKTGTVVSLVVAKMALPATLTVAV